METCRREWRLREDTTADFSEKTKSELRQDQTKTKEQVGEKRTTLVFWTERK